MMPLSQEISVARKDIRTDEYQMSIGEWASLYEGGELDIHPEFQRLFRWSDEQKSNLIESILLGIPIPPIFVSQRGDGVWDVIDGLQRLSTIFQTMGILKDEGGSPKPPLVLKATKYLPSIDGKSWEGDDDRELEADLKRLIRRSRIGVSIILRESDENTKFDLFERLNTGGSALSEQEVRNCILVMVDKSCYEWLRSLTEIASFKNTTALSEKLLSEQYDMELALRFVLFADADEQSLKSVGDVGTYITSRMIEFFRDPNFDRTQQYERFKAVFDTLWALMEESAFKRYSPDRQKHMGSFLVSLFEAVTAGADELIRENKDVSVIPVKAAALWQEDSFTNWARSGVTASRRLWRIIPFSRRYFSE